MSTVYVIYLVELIGSGDLGSFLAELIGSDLGSFTTKKIKQWAKITNKISAFRVVGSNLVQFKNLTFSFMKSEPRFKVRLS